MIQLSTVMAVMLAVASGCSRKEGDKGAAGGAEATSGAAAPGGAAASSGAAGGGAAGDRPAASAGGAAAGGGAGVKLPKLGLAIVAPGEIAVGDALLGEGHMLQGAGVGAMSVEIAKAPQTLDEAKEDAKMYSPQNVKADPLPDGWALSFENKGGAGTNYWVDVRRTIDGKLYKCTTTGSDAGQAAAVLAACKSLRKG